MTHECCEEEVIELKKGGKVKRKRCPKGKHRDKKTGKCKKKKSKRRPKRKGAFRLRRPTGATGTLTADKGGFFGSGKLATEARIARLQNLVDTQSSNLSHSALQKHLVALGYKPVTELQRDRHYLGEVLDTIGARYVGGPGSGGYNYADDRGYAIDPARLRLQRRFEAGDALTRGQVRQAIHDDAYFDEDIAYHGRNDDQTRADDRFLESYGLGRGFRDGMTVDEVEQERDYNFGFDRPDRPRDFPRRYRRPRGAPPSEGEEDRPDFGEGRAARRGSYRGGAGYSEEDTDEDSDPGEGGAGRRRAGGPGAAQRDRSRRNADREPPRRPPPPPERGTAEWLERQGRPPPHAPGARPIPEGGFSQEEWESAYRRGAGLPQHHAPDAPFPGSRPRSHGPRYAEEEEAFDLLRQREQAEELQRGGGDNWNPDWGDTDTEEEEHWIRSFPADTEEEEEGEEEKSRSQLAWEARERVRERRRSKGQTPRAPADTRPTQSSDGLDHSDAPLNYVDQPNQRTPVDNAPVHPAPRHEDPGTADPTAVGPFQQTINVGDPGNQADRQSRERGRTDDQMRGIEVRDNEADRDAAREGLPGQTPVSYRLNLMNYDDDVEEVNRSLEPGAGRESPVESPPPSPTGRQAVGRERADQPVAPAPAGGRTELERQGPIGGFDWGGGGEEEEEEQAPQPAPAPQPHPSGHPTRGPLLGTEEVSEEEVELRKERARERAREEKRGTDPFTGRPILTDSSEEVSEEEFEDPQPLTEREKEILRAEQAREGIGPEHVIEDPLEERRYAIKKEEGGG